MKKLLLIVLLAFSLSCSRRARIERLALPYLDERQVPLPANQQWTAKDQRTGRKYAFLGFSFRFYLSHDFALP